MNNNFITEVNRMKTPHIRDFEGKRIHMIGIGGSSMSGLAEMLIDQGYQVSGSDRDETYLVHFVREKNAKVTIGHKAENIHGADLVVYSAAISADNPERAEAALSFLPDVICIASSVRMLPSPKTESDGKSLRMNYAKSSLI